MKEMLPIEPMNMEDIAELSVSAEAYVDAFGHVFEIGSPVSESKKWSSLIIALVMHCVLALAICIAGKPQPPARHDWMEVQLIGSLGGAEGAAPGPSAAAAQTGGGPETVEKEPARPSPPEPVPPPVRKEPVRPKPPVRAPEKKKTPSAVPSKEPAVEKKIAAEDTEHPKEEPPARAEDNGVAGAAVSNGASGGPGPGVGAPSGSGPVAPGERAGNGGRGMGGGNGEMAFGSPGGPRFLHKVIPPYPPFARQQEMQGTVLLRLSIDERGRVLNVEVLKKAGFGFDEAAVKAINESTFVPAKRDGKSCSCKAILPIRFELKSSDAD